MGSSITFHAQPRLWCHQGWGLLLILFSLSTQVSGDLCPVADPISREKLPVLVVLRCQNPSLPADGTATLWQTW